MSNDTVTVDLTDRVIDRIRLVARDMAEAARRDTVHLDRQQRDAIADVFDTMTVERTGGRQITVNAPLTVASLDWGNLFDDVIRQACEQIDPDWQIMPDRRVSTPDGVEHRLTY